MPQSLRQKFNNLMNLQTAKPCSHNSMTKTQFHNQINKHNKQQSPFCEWCQEHLKMDIKESLVHALWDCLKYLTSTLILLKHSTSTEINSVWILLICSILTAKYNNSQINSIKLANKIKREIKDTNKSYPNRSLNTECRYLSFEEFLASYEAKGFYWTVHKTSAKI